MYEAANDPSLITPSVCHQTIYCAIYAQPRGTLRTEAADGELLVVKSAAYLAGCAE